MDHTSFRYRDCRREPSSLGGAPNPAPEAACSPVLVGSVCVHSACAFCQASLEHLADAYGGAGLGQGPITSYQGSPSRRTAREAITMQAVAVLTAAK